MSILNLFRTKATEAKTDTLTRYAQLIASDNPTPDQAEELVVVMSVLGLSQAEVERHIAVLKEAKVCESMAASEDQLTAEQRKWSKEMIRLEAERKAYEDNYRKVWKEADTKCSYAQNKATRAKEAAQRLSDLQRSYPMAFGSEGVDYDKKPLTVNGTTFTGERLTEVNANKAKAFEHKQMIHDGSKK